MNTFLSKSFVICSALWILFISGVLNTLLAETENHSDGQPQIQDTRQKFDSLSSEEKEQIHKFKENHREMTPEQRETFYKRHMQKGKRQGQDKQGQPGENRRGNVKERPDNLTPEQKQKIQDFQEKKEKMKDMTPEQRREAIADLSDRQEISPGNRERLQKRMEYGEMGKGDDVPEKHQSELRERFEKLRPEEKQQIREFRHKARDMSPEERRKTASKLPLFKDMTPEQREHLKQRFQRFQKMSPNEKTKVLKNFERWQKLSPEQRDEFRKKMQERKKSDPFDKI